MNIEFEKYIKTVNPNKIEDYDITKPESYDDELLGLRFKSFVRLSSEYFGDLINELRSNPKCSYDTYMNDVIKSGHTPQFISILQKEKRPAMVLYDRTGIEYFREICASRLLNFFECPTTYETMLDIGGDFYCCSVDFCKMGEEFNSIDSYFNELSLDISDTSLNDSLESNLKNFNEMLDRLQTKNNFKDFETLKNKFIEDYIYSFLFRRYVLGDIDCWFNNFGIITNSNDKSFRMAPNFDLECAFSFHPCQNLSKDIEEVKKNYPNVYKKFKDKYTEFISEKNGKKVYEVIIQNEIGNGKHAKDFVNMYSHYLKNLDSCINNESINISSEKTTD